VKPIVYGAIITVKSQQHQSTVAIVW